MTFVLNGMKMIKTSADGKKTEGTFMFSMQETTEPVGIGLLNLNGTNILCGHDFNDPGFGVSRFLVGMTPVLPHGANTPLSVCQKTKWYWA